MLNIYHTGGSTQITGDSELLALAANTDLATVDLAGFRVDADALAKIFNDAMQSGGSERKKLAEKYAALRKSYLENI